jgi:hypothetical protein
VQLRRDEAVGAAQLGEGTQPARRLGKGGQRARVDTPERVAHCLPLLCPIRARVCESAGNGRREHPRGRTRMDRTQRVDVYDSTEKPVAAPHNPTC